MRRAAARLQHRVGRRGASLLFFGLLDLVYCYSLLSPPPRSAWSPSLVFLDSIVPLWAWAAAWGAVGLLCLCRSYRRRDAAAFAAAIAIKVLWAIASLAAWLVGGVDRGYVNTVVWLAFAGFVAIIASWPEPVNGKGRPSWTPPMS
jgi:hypothetical protein